ncbi:MAG: divergent polysaccharide deacetylase family protein [Alphaproteobacteria bacterium]|nr:divergent polysaccharide deacetylase family protein [Alphaproteobacteria bacterium]
MTTALKQYFHPKSFALGLGAVFAVYLLLFIYLAFTASSTLEKLESKLAQDGAVIQRGYANYDQVVHTEHRPSQHQEAVDLETLNTKRSGDALVPAPVDGLYEHANAGLLPKIADSGATPFNVYKKPFALPGKPIIALVINDYGLSASNSAEVLKELPAEVTLMLSPYTDDPEGWQKRARENGHEFWIQTPIAGDDFPIADPGTQALFYNASLKQNSDRLEWIMARTTGYAGLAAATDTMSVTSPALINSILSDVKKRGLGFFELNPDAPDITRRFAERESLPFIRNLSFAHNTSLKELEKTARETGFVVAVVEPYPNTINSLRIWTNTLEAKGFGLAPLSAIPKLNPFIEQE